MLIGCRATAPASDAQVASEVGDILRRRAALDRAPATLTVSDAVALGIADQFRNSTPAGQVLDRFRRGDSIDSAELIEAVQFEQGFASPEGYGALLCLLTWVHGRVYRQTHRRHATA